MNYLYLTFCVMGWGWLGIVLAFMLGHAWARAQQQPSRKQQDAGEDRH